jgi:hypothetical protein
VMQEQQDNGAVATVQASSASASFTSAPAPAKERESRSIRPMPRTSFGGLGTSTASTTGASKTTIQAPPRAVLPPPVSV